MKNTIKRFFIIAVMVMIAFSACGDSGNGNNGGSKDTAVTLSGVTANGSASQTTTQLTLTFSQAITGLSADDITLSDVSGVTKGTLSGSGPAYTLGISGIFPDGSLSVAVAKSGYNISGSPKAVAIYYNNGSSLTIDMVTITGGTFTMGSPTSESITGSNETQHSVTLNGFYMGKYQVTQEQYQAVMGSNPSGFKSAVTGESGTPGKLPVEGVSWFDALVFCNKLSMAKGLNPVYSISGSTDPAVWGVVPYYNDSANQATWDAVVMDKSKNGYRLPTEAEWEYACRGSYTNKATETNTKPFGIGDGTKMISGMANFNGTYPYDLAQSGNYNDAGGTNLGKMTAVGSYAANNYGLYDMHGNLYEWCWDWYGSYSSGSQTDPTGAVTGSYRVRRGGSWFDVGNYLRSAYRRNDYNPYDRYGSIGFRLVRSN